MERIANFYKVSYDQFYKDYLAKRIKCYCDTSATDSSDDKYHSIVKPIYDNIALPKRSTSGSAGYDFITPVNIVLPPGHNTTIPTGIRVSIDDGWVLNLYPRSSIGFKFNIKLANTVGIIDSDYFNAKNEGHIMIKLINESDKDEIVIKQYERFVQGVFLPYGITKDDNVDTIRIGGTGSTGTF